MDAGGRQADRYDKSAFLAVSPNAVKGFHPLTAKPNSPEFRESRGGWHCEVSGRIASPTKAWRLQLHALREIPKNKTQISKNKQLSKRQLPKKQTKSNSQEGGQLLIARSWPLRLHLAALAPIVYPWVRCAIRGPPLYGAAWRGEVDARFPKAWRLELR